MDIYEKLIQIKKYTDSIGTIYGTEDFSIYLYSIIKMSKPTTVLELGTGLGTTMLWSALALQENNQGIVYTVDNGSEWEHLKKAQNSIQPFYKENYADFINNLIHSFEFSKQIIFYNQTIANNNELSNIDILFSDYSHGPYSVINLLAKQLVNMADNSYIFIDSASTYYPSYQILESVIAHFNNGKIPKTVLEMIDVNDIPRFREKIINSKFEISHIIENKNRNQNSTTQIKISPLDIMPQPRINIRF